jgi:hypothetical protein
MKQTRLLRNKNITIDDHQASLKQTCRWVAQDTLCCLLWLISYKI